MVKLRVNGQEHIFDGDPSCRCSGISVTNLG